MMKGQWGLSAYLAWEVPSLEESVFHLQPKRHTGIITAMCGQAATPIICTQPSVHLHPIIPHCLQGTDLETEGRVRDRLSLPRRNALYVSWLTRGWGCTLLPTA